MAIKGYGTVISYSDTLGGTYTAIGAIRDFTSPKPSASMVDTTNYDGGGWKTFEGGLKDGGEFSVTVEYVPATHSTLTAFLGVSKFFKIIFPPTASAKGYQFQAVMKDYDTRPPMDGVVEAIYSFKVSGAPTVL
jgi:hypothetical protein